MGNMPIIRTKDFPVSTIRSLWDCLDDNRAILQCEYEEKTPPWLQAAMKKKKANVLWSDIVDVESEREVYSMKLYISLESMKKELSRLSKCLKKIEII